MMKAGNVDDLSVKSFNLINYHIACSVQPLSSLESLSYLNCIDLFKIFQVSHLFLFGLRLVLDFNLLVYAFGQLPLVVCTWICMFLSVLLVPYTLFHQWSQTQSGSFRHPRLCSFLFGSVFLLYQALGLGFLPAYVVVTNSLPPASRFIIILEQVGDQRGCF